MNAAHPAGFPPAMTPREAPGREPVRLAALRALDDRVRACTACDAQRPANLRVVGDGPTDAPIVIIGEAPGAEEEIAGRPFVGPSGSMLDAWLASAGIIRDRVRVMNALSCRPTEPGARRGTLRNRQPTKPEQKACRVHALAQLAALDPGVIVCVGGTALALFNPRLKLAEVTSPAFNGYVQANGEQTARMNGMPPMPRPWVRLFVVYHPAGVMRLQRTSKDAYEAAVRASVARLADARAYVEKHMPERTGVRHG
jgi:uracil-DNA glycosylase family 4